MWIISLVCVTEISNSSASRSSVTPSMSRRFKRARLRDALRPRTKLSMISHISWLLIIASPLYSYTLSSLSKQGHNAVICGSFIGQRYKNKKSLPIIRPTGFTYTLSFIKHYFSFFSPLTCAASRATSDTSTLPSPLRSPLTGTLFSALGSALASGFGFLKPLKPPSFISLG